MNLKNRVVKKTDGPDEGRLKFSNSIQVSRCNCDRLADAECLLRGRYDNSKTCRIMDRHFG